MAIHGRSVWSFQPLESSIAQGIGARSHGPRAGVGRGDPAGHWKVGEDDEAK